MMTTEQRNSFNLTAHRLGALQAEITKRTATRSQLAQEGQWKDTSTEALELRSLEGERADLVSLLGDMTSSAQFYAEITHAMGDFEDQISSWGGFYTAADDLRYKESAAKLIALLERLIEEGIPVIPPFPV